jgi:hypothetical protein
MAVSRSGSRRSHQPCLTAKKPVINLPAAMAEAVEAVTQRLQQLNPAVGNAAELERKGGFFDTDRCRQCRM